MDYQTLFRLKNFMSVTTIAVEAAPKTKWETHNDWQREVIDKLTAQIVKSETIDPGFIESTINPNFNNTLIRDFAIKHDIVNKAQFNEMLRKAKIKDELDAIPMNAVI